MGIIKKKLNYVTLDRIKREHAHYNLLIGQRSNGKTFAVFKEALERFVKTGEQSALIRRWREDFRGKRGESMFRGLVSQGIPGKLTDGKWTEIAYYAGRWYLARYDEEKDKLIKHPEPFCFAFALSEMEHDKSTSYDNITLVMFDEFISRNGYLNDEFVIFQNVLSTIIRQRENVKIFMLGNTVLHLPHSSRPWKRLKYTNPLLYYWRKITQRKDRI